MIFSASRLLPAAIRESVPLIISNFFSAAHHADVLASMAEASGNVEAAAVGRAFVRGLEGAAHRRLGVRGRELLLNEAIVNKYGVGAIQQKFLTGPAEQDLTNVYLRLVKDVAEPQHVFIPIREDYRRNIFPDVAAVFTDASTMGLDAVVNEFKALNPKVDESVLRALVETLYHRAIRSAAALPTLGTTKEAAGILPQVSFLYHRHNIVWPQRYVAPIAESYKQYLEGLGDMVAVRGLEKELAVALGMFPDVDAAGKALMEAERIMWKTNKNIEIGWFLRGIVVPMIQARARESGPWVLVNNIADVALKSMSRDLGMIDRSLTADIARSLVGITSAWTSGIAQVTQFVNTMAMNGILRTLRVMAQAALDKGGREGLRRLATGLGQYEAMFYEDILRRRIEPEIIEAMVKSGVLPSPYILVSKLNRLQEKILKMVGLDVFERMLRMVDLGAQREFLREGLQKPQSRDFQAFLRLHRIPVEHARRALETMDALFTGKIPVFDAEAIHTALLTTRATQMFYTGAELPVLLATHPVLDALSTFKKFSYMMSESFFREAIGRARNGDWAPLIRAALVVAPVMYGGDYLIRGLVGGTIWRAYPKRDGDGFVIAIDQPTFLDPKTREGILRRASAYSPLMAGYAQVVLESGVLGMFGEAIEAFLTGNRYRAAVSLEPVLVSHAANVLFSIGRMLSDILGGDVEGFLKEAATMLSRYGIPQAAASLVPVPLRAGVHPAVTIATSFVGVLPRTLSRTYMQLKDDRERLRTARKDAVKMFIFGDPRFADLQAYLLAEFGPDAIIKDSDVRRELKSRALAIAGLTQAEVSFKKKYTGDEHIDDLEEEILDEDLKELSERAKLDPLEWLWP